MAGRILVVEDDDFIRDIIAVSLRDEGHVVDEASSATETWACIKRHAPDLVLLDLALPEEDGLSICRKLRAMPETGSLPIVFVSALSQPMYVQAAAQAGGNGFIKKPFDIDNLSATVRRLLPGHRPQSEQVAALGAHPLPHIHKN